MPGHTNIPLDLLAMALLLLAAALVAGTETALFNLSRGQLYQMRHSADRTDRLVPALMRYPRRVLNTLLLANLLISVAFAALGAVVTLDLGRRGAPGWQLAAASVGPLVVLILFGEVMPKLLAFATAARWAALSVRAMGVVGRVLSPALWLMDQMLVGPMTRLLAPRRAPRDITVRELAALLDLSARRGIIAHDANVLLQEIVDLTQLRVSDIMVPRVDMVAYDVNDPPAGLVELFRKSHLRKMPAYDGQPDRVLGVIYGKTLLLNPGKPLRELVVKLPFVPETANVERLLIQLRVTRKQMAIVVDEFGGVAGLVTLQDIVEQIVGDIYDARDAQARPAVQRVSERVCVIDGNLSIHDWAEAFRMDLPPGRVTTVGGFVTSLLGRIPKEGDQVRYRNLRITVLSLRGRRIGELQVELVSMGDSRRAEGGQ
jgi:CBS domain containing-hemolysin-like protein